MKTLVFPLLFLVAAGAAFGRSESFSELSANDFAETLSIASVQGSLGLLGGVCLAIAVMLRVVRRRDG